MIQSLQPNWAVVYLTKRITSLILLACAGISPSEAQTTPDAGLLRQQREAPSKPRLPTQQPNAESTPKVPSALKGDSPQIVLQSVRFQGNTLISSETLVAVVARWLERSVQLADLREAATLIAAYYRNQGWVVDVQLPPQDITGGIVTLQVNEGVFGDVQVDGEPTLRFDRKLAIERVQKHHSKGMLLNTQALDRTLLILDDLPGVNVVGKLAAGQGANETALVLRMSDEPLVRGDVNLDNYGARSTGATRLSSNFTLNSPAGLGDMFSANLLLTEGSRFGRVAYSLPVGQSGWRVSMNGSGMDYKLIAPEFAALDGKGKSTYAGADASYPLLRSRSANLYLNFAVDHKDFDNQANRARTSHYTTNSFTAGLTGNVFDTLGGGGANSANLAFSQGLLDFGALDSGENQALAGRFNKLRYALSRQQALGKTVSLYLAYSGQLANRNLDSSERFYLGGANGVRAYPSSEGGGSEGQQLSLELRWQLGGGMDLSPFYDRGRVRQQTQNATARPNEYELSGYGLTFGWTLPSSVALKFTWARRDGRNPNPTVTGNDQDGSHVKNRLWFSASVPF